MAEKRPRKKVSLLVKEEAIKGRFTEEEKNRSEVGHIHQKGTESVSGISESPSGFPGFDVQQQLPPGSCQSVLQKSFHFLRFGLICM